MDKVFTVRDFAEEHGISVQAARGRLERAVRRGEYCRRLVRKVDKGGLNCEKGPRQYSFPNRPAFAQYWKTDDQV